MIKVIAEKDVLFTIGHAEYAPRGQDIVCAAASALINALAAALDEEGILRHCEMEPGFSLICASRPHPAFAFVHRGLKQLAQEYPHHVLIWNDPFPSGKGEEAHGEKEAQEP